MPPPLLPRAEHGKIHGVAERIPMDGIAEMADIVYALIEEWNKQGLSVETRSCCFLPLDLQGFTRLEGLERVLSRIGSHRQGM